MTRLVTLALALLVSAGCIAPAQRTVKSQLITAAQGGTITIGASDDATLAGVSITIPPHALSSDTTIVIGTGSASAIPSGGTAAGPAVEFGPDGLQFARPVTITLPYQLAGGTTTANLNVAALESTGARSYFASSQLMIASSTLSFETSGFTTYAPYTSRQSGGAICIAPPDGGTPDQGPPPAPTFFQGCAADIPHCVPPGMSAPTLQPAWSYQSSSQNLAFSGVFDAQGDRYFIACPAVVPSPQPGTCDLVALSSGGKELWRLKDAINNTGLTANINGMVIGQTLLLVSQTLSPMLQARRLSDGSLLWSNNALTPEPIIPAMAAVSGGSQVAVMGESQNIMGVMSGLPNGISIFDVASGSILGTTSISQGDGDYFICSDGATFVWNLFSQYPGEGLLDVGVTSGRPGQPTLGQMPPQGGYPSSSDQLIVAEFDNRLFSYRYAWDWPNLVSGFPAPDTQSLQDLVIRADGVAFVAGTPDNSPPGPPPAPQTNCNATFVDSYDATLAHRLSHCMIAKPLAGPSDIHLTADGGAALLTPGEDGSLELVVVDASGGTELVAELGGLPCGWVGAGSALIGSRLFVTAFSGSVVIPDTQLAYDLPGITAATHGWLTSGGSPQRTFAPQ